MSFAKQGGVGKTSTDGGHEIFEGLCFCRRRKVEINDFPPQYPLPAYESGNCKERA